MASEFYCFKHCFVSQDFFDLKKIINLINKKTYGKASVNLLVLSSLADQSQNWKDIKLSLYSLVESLNYPKQNSLEVISSKYLQKSGL